VELPIEATTGIGGTNHWSAWQIDVDKWKTYLSPIDTLLRSNFEKRVVKQYGDEYSLESDATGLIAKPDETDVIIKLMTLQQVTPESGVAALQGKAIDGLVAQKPPLKPTDTSGTTAPDQPSDFGTGDTNRGGGKYRENP
jgi:hypothetical protein